MAVRAKGLAEVRAVLASEMTKLLSHLTPNAFMALVCRHIRRWNTAFKMPAPQAVLVEKGVLQNSFPAFLLLQRRDPARASHWVVQSWHEYAAEARKLPTVGNPQSMLDYDLAVHEFLAAAERETDGRRIVRRLMTHLGLSQDEVGRMFNVSGETIRRWERGQVRIPQVRMAELTSFDAALARLTALFVPDRLPQVIRRRADLFEGERALDFVLRGRIATVADRYETALAYQA